MNSIKHKKILYIHNDKKNIFIDYLIKSLRQNNTVNIISNKEILEKNKFEKIINYLSNPLKSEKEKFYFKYSLYKNKNILKKILLILKFVLAKLNLLFNQSALYCFLYKNSKQYKKILSKYDVIICDFRLNKLYNPNKKIIFEACANNKVKVIAWVYSWDNIYQSSVIEHADYIFVWSKFFEKICIDRHNYTKKQIKITGPVQFDYLKLSKEKKTRKKNKYILFACSYGSDPEKTGDNFIKDEIVFLKNLSSIMETIDKDLKIIVRPYPSADPADYYSIKNLSNIKIVEFGKFIKRRAHRKERIRFDSDFSKKIKQMLNAELIISFGSTFNIESSCLNKIILHIDYTYVDNKNSNSYNNFKDNMEYLKILKPYNFPNIIKNEIELKKTLQDILIHKKLSKYRKYNNYLKKIFFDDNKLAANKFNNIISKI